MLQSFKFSLILGMILIFQKSSADVCELGLNPQYVKTIFFEQTAKGFPLVALNQTPLEVSATFRRWKEQIALKLGIDSENISGKYQRNLTHFEEISRPTETRVLLVRTANGIKALIIVEINLTAQTLTYIDPTFPGKTYRSTAFRHPYDGKTSLFVTAMQDAREPSGTTGAVVGILTVKIPYLNL